MIKVQDRPLVSVIIATYNRPNLLSDAISSVLNQTYENYEVIVVNDYGEDVWDVIESFNSDKIIYLSHIMNKGLPYARNTGIKASNGEIIFYLDDDDLFLPDHIDECVKVYLQNSSINVVYTDTNYLNEVIKNNQRVIISQCDMYIGNTYSHNRLLVGNYIPINCISHRKTVIDTVGLFDENLKSHEDWEFLLRISSRNDFYHLAKITVEVRNRININDNMLSKLKGGFYKIYRKVYQRYPSPNIEVFIKRQRILYSLLQRVDTKVWSFQFIRLKLNYLKHRFLFIIFFIANKYFKIGK